MDSGKTDNERELTSTMGNVLSVSIKDEKNDTSGSDATPTSSTDANTSTTSSRIVSDDPISSTSSDVVELNKSKNLEVSIQSSTEISETAMDEPDKSSVDPESDLLEMSISSVSRERITEDVEDLVHDLESLLGESTDSFNIPIKRREDQKSPTAKESAKTSPNPSDRGDTLSPDDNASDKNVESAQDDERKEDIIIETSNLNLQQETDAIEEKIKDEAVICNINETETKEETNENESSESEKQTPTETSFEHEAGLVAENVIEEISHDIKVNESEIICETENKEISELVGDVITNEVNIVQEDLEDKIKDVIVEKVVDTNEQLEHEQVIEQSKEEAVIEKMDVEDSTSECKPSEQLQDEEDSASQESEPIQDKEEVGNVTVEKEVEQSEVILVASSSDSTIQADGSEKTEEAGICQEESISRDIKTDIVESLDHEGKEPQSSTTKELEASSGGDDSPCIETDAQNEKEHELDSENIVIPQEMKEVPSENNVDTEIVEDSATTQLISDSSDHDQAEEQESVAPALEVDAVETNISEEVPPKIIAQVPEELESEEVDENFELVLTEETESQPTDVPSEKEEVTEVFVLEETENQPSDQPEEEHSARENEVEITEEIADSSEDTDVKIECKIEDATVTLDSGATEVSKEFEASEVQESQENIPKTRNEETDLEDISAVIQEAVDNAETKESVVLPAEDSIEPPVETEPRSPIIESTLCTEISTDLTETTVIEESNSESNKLETIQSIDDKSEAETIIEQTVATETSELVSDGLLTTSNSSSTKIKVSENDERQTPSPVEIPEILVPEVEEIDSDKIETETVEKCEESIPEQIPEISEDVEKETQPVIEDVDDEVSSPPQKVFLGFEEIEDAEISVAKPDELGERTDDFDDSNYVVTEPIEQEIPQETEESSDEITKFSITFSEITNEIIETGDTALEEVATSQFGPEVSELEQVSTEDSQQEHVLHWVEDLAPIENEEAGSSLEGIDKKLVEIMDEDSKIMEPEPESVTFFTPSADSDSEDTVPTLVLEPDEVLPSPEPVSSEKINEPALVADSTDDVPEKLPEIEEILNDEGNVDDVVENIDMQENLETILAVASLQDVPEPAVESQMSDKERREMEALRMAVESITDTSDTVVYGDVEPLSELVASVEQSIDQIPSGTDVMDTLIGESKSSTEEVEEPKTPNVEIDSEEKQVQSSVEVNDMVCANKPELVEENHLKEDGTLPDTSEDKISASGIIRDIIGVLPDSSQGILACDEVKLAEGAKEKEGKARVNERAKRHKKSTADSRFEELSINVDVPEREKPYSPKVTIKPIKVPDEEVSTTSNSDSEFGKGGLKMTITKQFDKMHSVLKICDSDSSDPIQEQDEPIPKLIIKPKMQQVEQQHSPKMSTRSSKQMYSPTSSSQRSGSPRITIKPVVKPDKVESVTPLKIKIKPEEGSKRHSPKLNIKPVTKSEEEGRENIQSPRKVTIKPIKTPEELEQIQSPKITIKHIPKPDLDKEGMSITPRLSIKPIKRDDEDIEADRERSSPKITIKPVKPPETEVQVVEPDDAVKERIVLKINKGNLPQTPTKDSKKREHPPDDEKSEKLAKITVKFSKGGGHPHIVQQSEDTNKRPHEEQSPEKMKKAKVDNDSASFTRSKHKDSSEMDPSKTKQKETDTHLVETRSKHTHLICDSPVEAKRVKLKDTPESSKQRDSINEAQRTKSNNDFGDDIRIIEAKLDSPIVISEDSRSQDSGSCVIIEDRKEPLTSTPLHDVSMKGTPETPQAVPIKQDKQESVCGTPTVPRKRGRPRKVPIVVREDFKEQEEPKKEEPPPQLLHESGRPKRSCRGQSVRATLGIKPRKPRGPGRGRGGKRGMGTRVVPMKPEGEPKLSKAKLKLIQESLKVELLRTDEVVERDRKAPEVVQVLGENIKPPAPVPAQREAQSLTSETPRLPSALLPEPSPQSLLASPASLPGASLKPAGSLLTAEITDSAAVLPATPSTSRAESAEIVMVDEETRMSADTNSRAHTPAKQVVPADGVIEESQSSVQSTGTTESGKATSSRPNKAPRLEVQEPEGAVISADQLTEYYWNGNGPFMLQEQVAQFLGIKSFKRKYPGIMRRMLEIQERDFIRESGLASEHMCDLGLTAVNSADILDIMYSDFQEKYEEYCKHQRDRQAKDLINKQKALSLAASQDKNKADITEQAVQSAAQWNASFNKARKDHRKACMDLQTLTVHYPKGKMKQINKPKVGNYPVALVPGQFTDYYKEFTPTEINNLPLNTMLYNEINIVPPEESEESGTDGSESDSDSSSSSSGSCSSSSGVEDCKLCKHTPKKGSSK